MSDYNYGQQPPGGVPPGYPPPQQPGSYLPYPPPDQQQEQPGNGMAVAGMVLGIISVVLFFIPLVGAVIALVGLILSFAGMSRANNIGGKGKGMAIAGLVCSIVGLLLGAYMIYAVFVAVNEVNKYKSKNHYDWDLVLPVAGVLVGAASNQLRRVLGRVGSDLRADRGL
ncbi:MAG TPA: DUF4190 domain-containing protein [Kofleriaceae bacterium]|nr:DUF4190 domain-containing protein [Kofleriaceae bacterium]